MIVTLCGSARFEGLFHQYNEELTLAGHTVLSLSVFPSYKGEKGWYTEEQKARLDVAHKDKIELSDAIVILNKDGYKGPSTLSEEAHAQSLGKHIYYLESRYEQNVAQLL